MDFLSQGPWSTALAILGTIVVSVMANLATPLFSASGRSALKTLGRMKAASDVQSLAYYERRLADPTYGIITTVVHSALFVAAWITMLVALIGWDTPYAGEFAGHIRAVVGSLGAVGYWINQSIIFGDMEFHRDPEGMLRKLRSRLHKHSVNIPTIGAVLAASRAAAGLEPSDDIDSPAARLPAPNGFGAPHT